MSKNTQFTHISGAQIAWEQEGTGPSAIFVHGFGGNKGAWQPLWPFLSDGQRRLIRYDLRGFGQSVERSGEPFNHCDDLPHVIDSVASFPCDLIGVSMGGSIALNVALNYPEMIRSLILISPDIIGWEWSETWKSYKSEIEATARQGDLGKAKQLWWAHPMFSTTRVSSNAQLLREEIQSYSGAHWISSNPALVESDIERLHTLRTPTLLLTGGQDFDDLQVIASLIEASSSCVERLHNDEGGHLLHFDDPDWCVTHIQRFLAKYSPL